MAKRTPKSKPKLKKPKSANSWRLKNRMGMPLNGDAWQMVVEGYENGLIIGLEDLVFPIIMRPGAFAINEEEEKLKGSAAYDARLFQKQNNRATKMSKASIRKYLQETTMNMALTEALLAGELSPRSRSTGELMGPTLDSASGPYSEIKRKYEDGLNSYVGQDQKDAFIVREYAKAIKSLGRWIPELDDLYKKDKEYLEPLTKINPSKYAVTQKQKKAAAKVKKPPTAFQIEKEAKAYAKQSDKRGLASKLKKKYGDKITQKIIRLAKKEEAKLQSKNKPSTSKSSRKSSTKSTRRKTK